jgi:hypothetical protein
MKAVQHWGVDIRINGERVLTIESNSLSGIENISDFADTVRECAEHLLAFIGDKRGYIGASTGINAPLSKEESEQLPF